MILKFCKSEKAFSLSQIKLLRANSITTSTKIVEAFPCKDWWTRNLFAFTFTYVCCSISWAIRLEIKVQYSKPSNCLEFCWEKAIRNDLLLKRWRFSITLVYIAVNLTNPFNSHQGLIIKENVTQSALQHSVIVYHIIIELIQWHKNAHY